MWLPVQTTSSAPIFAFSLEPIVKMQHAEIQVEERHDVVSEGLKIPPK